MGCTQPDHLLQDLYAARLSGDLDGACRAFAADAKFQIAGASETSPVGINAAGMKEFRPLLALMIKTFKLGALTIRTISVEGEHVTVHWEANVHSRITGATVHTEMIDIVEVRDGLIVNFNEVFHPLDRSSNKGGQV
ncbi:nuclear transport factor 2 family protein [Candidatus Binatus sp.]|uniref:nuclear transport factor 2 family protein n=1 Tax=Candidatus Binatus sp. TaxID=2811406 RepID=UPI003BB1F1C1